MRTQPRRWIFPAAIFVATCFGVFVLPFFFPPPYLAGISIANVAGFNNKVAAIAAGFLSGLVFWIAYRESRTEPRSESRDDGPISPRVVWLATLASGLVLTVLVCLVIRSHRRYLFDAGYFIEQITLHIDYGRRIYRQLDFPYGPLLFSGPVFLHALLSPFHVSIVSAYYATLVIEHLVGLLLVAYVVNALPMRRIWKTLLFLLCAIATIQLSLGLNYTFLRFIAGPAFLVLASRHRRPWFVAVCFLVGEMVNLALSPEMGVAFCAAGVAYAVYFSFTEGRAWLAAAAAPIVAFVVFLLLMDRDYLRMMRMFARGINNFVVEPLPHILLFLFALIWLVPWCVARFLRQRRPEAPLLAALYLFSIALVPVSFGRADPGHVFYNGLALFSLSMVAVSSLRPRRQALWAACVAGVFLWTIIMTDYPYAYQAKGAFYESVFGYQPDGFRHAISVYTRTHSLAAAKNSLTKIYEDHSFHIEQLDAVIGKAPIATPLELPLYVEDELRSTGQYVPSFYFAMRGPYDAAAENHVIREMNAVPWLLLRKRARVHEIETPKDTRVVLGFQLPYPVKHPPYVIGDRFTQNVRTHWQPYAEIGDYVVYRRRDTPLPLPRMGASTLTVSAAGQQQDDRIK